MIKKANNEVMTGGTNSHHFPSCFVLCLTPQPVDGNLLHNIDGYLLNNIGGYLLNNIDDNLLHNIGTLSPAQYWWISPA